jgi:hypothetical protein
LNNWEMTRDTVLDSLAQWTEGRRPNILLVDNGSVTSRTSGGDLDDPRDRFVSDSETAAHWVAAARDLLLDVDIVLTAHPAPGITLNAAWNLALWTIWEFGGERALVVNNDIRMHEEMFKKLSSIQAQTRALFVSGVNNGGFPNQLPEFDGNHGGPDFSCFLITKECHAKYPFDPRFTFAGDWDQHRRMIVGGDGDRIFGSNIPYLHIGEGSQTLKRMRETDPVRAQQIAETADQHRALYREKWGGTFGQETLVKPKWEVEV